MIYDPTELERLKSERAKASAARNECAKMLDAMFESDASWDEADNIKYAALKARYDWQGTQAASIDALIHGIENARPKTDAELAAIRSKPLTRWVKSGHRELSAEERIEQQNLLDTFGNDADAPNPKFVVPFDLSQLKDGPRAAVTTPSDTNARDRYIDQDYYETMSEYGGLTRVMSTIHTSHGNDLTFLTNQSDEGFNESYVSRQSNVAASQLPTGRVATDFDINAQDLNDEGIVIRPYLYNSGPVRINAFTFEDVAFDVGDWVRSSIFRRLGKRLEAEAMQGGATGMQGLWESTGTYTTVGTGSAVGRFTYSDALELSRQINESYLFGERGIGGYVRQEGIVCYVCSYALTKTVKSYVDSQNRPIYIPRVGDEGMYHLHGYPVYWTAAWNADQDDEANGQHPIAYGNFGYLTQRYCGGGIMIDRVHDASTALTNQVQFVGHVRWGVNCLGPRNSNSKSEAIIKAQIRSS